MKWKAASDCNTFYLPSRAIVRAVGVLLRNGFEASPAGSTITLSLFRDENEMVAEVRDEGSGMSPEILERAGEPFFTTKPVGEGTGLGLTLARQFVEMHGGKMWLESTPGVGSTFTFNMVAQLCPAN